MNHASDRARSIVSAARACVGVPFRPQGRDPDYGFDCVGLVAESYAQAGAEPKLPQGYAMRGGDGTQIQRVIVANGFAAVEPDDAVPGDLLLCAPAPNQFHLVILAENSFIHADAGLRRVVETPGPPPWPVLAAFRRFPDPFS